MSRGKGKQRLLSFHRHSLTDHMTNPWSVLLLGCFLQSVVSLMPCTTDTECERLINIEAECEVTAKCQGDCVFSAESSCDESEDLLQRRIQRFKDIVLKSRFYRDEWASSDIAVPGHNEWVDLYCDFTDYPDDAPEQIGNIFLKAMEDMHKVLEPVVDTLYTPLSSRIMLFRDGAIPMFEEMEDTYKRFIKTTRPGRLCWT